MSHQPVTLPLSPRLPVGLATPAQLRQLVDIAEKYGGLIKIAGNSLVILGLNTESRDQALAELNGNSQPLTAKTVRGVTVCAGKPHCPRAVQNSTALGLALDNKFYGTELPGKLRISVSGCPNCCSEVFVKDIGLYGVANGYTVVVGGNSGRQAQAGRIIAQKLAPENALPFIDRIINYYQTYGQPGERLGQTITRLGFEDFATKIGTH